jgi:putative ABC transport system ATP-binding protein
LANEPPILVADEPTGNLDAGSGAVVLGHLEAYWRRGGTLLIATHDPAIAAAAPRTLTLRDGRLAADERRGGVAA